MMGMPTFMIGMLASMETAAGILILVGGAGPEWATRIAGVIVTIARGDLRGSLSERLELRQHGDGQRGTRDGIPGYPDHDRRVFHHHRRPHYWPQSRGDVLGER